MLRKWFLERCAAGLRDTRRCREDRFAILGSCRHFERGLRVCSRGYLAMGKHISVT